MSIKSLRKSLDLTQKQASELVHIPLRTYIDYENDPTKEGSIKHLFIKERLEQYGFIDEEHGVLSVEKITKIVSSTLQHYEVDFCFLFGSYAKGLANPSSDVDLMISTKLNGMKFFGLIEELRETLKKRVEVIPISSLVENETLLLEILKDGIKIYG